MTNQQERRQLLQNGIPGVVKKLNILGLIFGTMILSTLLSNEITAQQTTERIMEQDSKLNNIVDPEGYVTAPLGSLGEVIKIGDGPQTLIFVAGLGFGADVFEDYLNAHSSEFTAYAITLPGFGGTSAPPSPSPSDSVSYGAQTWTNAAINAIEELIETERIEQPILVGHWMTGTQIALRLALKHPDLVKGVIIVAGVACYVGDTTTYPAHPMVETRINYVDQYLATNWFKTVTRETWDDNNFLPEHYAVNPILGLRLWRQAADPLLHVWVRYINEFFAQDISLELDSLKIPTLLLKPGFEGMFVENGMDVMKAYCHTSWDASATINDMIKVVTIQDSRLFIWYDQPARFKEEVDEFIAGLE